MTIPQDVLISAYFLIRKYGNGAEEYATQKMWEFQHRKDDENASAWQAMIDAIKVVRNTIPSGKPLSKP